MSKRPKTLASSLPRLIHRVFDNLSKLIVGLVIVSIIIVASLSILNIQTDFYPIVSELITTTGVIAALLPILITAFINAKDKAAGEFVIDLLSAEALLVISLIAGTIFLILSGGNVTLANVTGYEHLLYVFSGWIFGLALLMALVDFVFALDNFKYALAKKFGIKLDE